MRNIFSVIVAICCLVGFSFSNANAACPGVGEDLDIRFANISIDCAQDSLYVDVQVSNPTGANYDLGSMSLRFTYNTAMLGNAAISSADFAGTHTIQLQSGIWSYGVQQFGPGNTVPTGGAWQTVGTLSFSVLDYDAGSVANCINMQWVSTGSPVTTAQLWCSIADQPSMTFTSYGNNFTCISDSCSASTPDTLSLSGLVFNETCNGTDDGAIDLTITGGVSPYSILWSNGATTEDVSGLAPGTYAVTVTDNNGDSEVLSGLVVASSSLSVQITVVDVLCNAGSEGEILTSVSGGTAPYTYNWSTGDNTPNLTSIEAGSYSLTVTDVNGCTGVIKDIELTEPGEFQYNVNLQNVQCAGDSTGSLDFSLTGGIPPYSYLWIEYDMVSFLPIDTFATTEDVSNLTAGLYSVEITDDNGCTGAVFYLITEPPAIEITNVNITDATCGGSTNGAIDITATGGTGVLAYQWSNGAFTQDLQNVAAGDYIVTVTDLEGCTLVDTFTINQPDPVSIVLGTNGISDALCYGDASGSIDVTVTGGTAPYTYDWSPGSGASEDTSGLLAGTYALTVTDANGCTGTLGGLVVGEPDSLSLSVNSTEASCGGFADGTINLTVTGGTSPYTYLWSNGAVTEDASGLAVGIYTVTVTDANGCFKSITDTVVLGNCPPLARNDINNTLKNVPVSGDISTNDSDPDGDNLTFTVLSGPSNGTLTAFDPATGIYTYSPDNNFVGEDTYTYIVCDDGVPSLCDTATVYIEVLDDPKDPFNNPPIANADHFITYVDYPVNSTVINNDYDPDTADVITVNPTFITPPSNGTATVAPNGDFAYVPNPGFVGNDTLIYQLCDNGTPGPKCDTAIVVITVLDDPNNNNLPPVAVDDAFYTELNTPVPGNVLPNDYDPDSNQIIVTVPQFSGPNNGSVTINPNGSFTYTPNNGYVGPDQFVYIICDNGVPSLCDTATVYILIQNPANRPPLARNDINNTLVNTPVSGDVSTNDREPDGDAVTFTQLSNPRNGTISSFDPNTGLYTYVPNNGFIGTDEFTYSICDDGTPSLCDTATVTIHVIPPFNYTNNPPVANPDDYVVYEGDTLNSTVIPNDFDPDTADIISVGSILITPPGNGTVTNIQPNGDFTYIPDPGFTGDDTFEYVLCDNGTPSLCDTTIVTIHVLPTTGDSTNRPPVAVDDAYITEVGNPVNGDVIPNDYDLDGDNITVTVPQFSGPSNGTVTNISPTGGFTYVPNPGYTGPDQFTYILCDDGNPSLCDTATVYITIYDRMTIVLNPTDAPCFGESTGSIDLTVFNGTAPYTYEWSNGETTEDLSNIPAGTYTVTVTDAFGVVVIDSAVVNEAPQLVATITSTTDVSCNGEADGAIDLTVSGGTPPYTYSWTGGATSEDTSGLLAGAYSVTVTDANGCTATATATITEPNTLTATVTNQVNVSCNGGNDGSIDITVAGGTTPYTYLWSPGGATSEDTSGLAAGTYTVTVTDVNGCTATTSTTITESGTLAISLGGQTDVSCNGAADGSLDIDVTGGTAPYTYLWSPGGATSQDTSGLLAGTYTVTVTDDNGCSTSASYTVTEPATLTATVTSTTDASCNGFADGAIDITVTGGTTPYTFAWTGGGASEDTSGLAAGIYTVTVTDANGCIATTSATITEPNVLIVDLDNQTDVSCNGGADGAIDIAVSGGTTPYTFAWTGGGASEDTSGLTAGTYGVTVTDANGCTATGSFTITEPDALVASVSASSNVTCFGDDDGSIDLTVTGGTTPYTFAWTGGGASEDTSGLAAGTYGVTVTDANGCTATASATITEPDTLTITLDGVTDVSCNGDADGAVDVTINGGTAPYTYAWTGGGASEDTSGLLAGTYGLTVTDANGCTATGSYTVNEPTALTATISSTENVACNGGNNGTIDVDVNGGTAPYTYAWTGGGATQDTAGLTAGTYTLTVTDANGCTATVSATISEPDALVATVTSFTNVTCNGSNDGSIDVDVVGGTAPYTYFWSPGAAATQDTSGLSAGTYSLTVTDANGCTATVSQTITEESPVTISLNGSNDVSCFGDTDGAIDIDVTGGVTPYTYIWSPGNGASQDTSGLAAGTYTVTVTDGAGCSSTATYTINQPDELSVTYTKTDVACAGGNDGSIDLTVAGGTAPYSFAWNNGASTEDLTALVEGIYDVTVTDANGCSATTTVGINTITTLVLNTAATNATCGDTNGVASVSVSGGNAPYTYLWSNGETTNIIDTLTAGVYTVTVTEAGGCSATASVTVNSTNGVTITPTVTDVVCGNTSTGSITLTVTGGSGNYTYLWSNNETGSSINNLRADTYNVTVTDVNTGCVGSASITVNELSPVTASATSTGEACGQADGTATITAAGGTAPYTYAWANGQATATASGLTSGVYTFTVTDANGCTATGNVSVGSANGPAISVDNVTDLSCASQSTGAIDISVTGGTPPYTYVWSNGSTTADLNGILSGPYTVTVTDANGCSAATFVTVDTPDEIIITADRTDVSCHGDADGAVDVTVTGGVAPYSYLWSNGANTEDLSGLSGGTYTITVSDANGCSASTPVVIGEPDELELTYTNTDITCAGTADGSIDLTVAGGTAPYTYIWSNGETTEDLANLAAGLYTVYLTDANGCTEELSISILGPNALVLNTASTNSGCNETNGVASVSVAGGVGPYTYEWSNGETTATIDTLAAGTYTVTVTDASGCTATEDVQVVGPAPISVAVNVTNSSCGQNNGSIELVIGGVLVNPTIQWSNGESTATITNLAPGSYTATVTDPNGCSEVITAAVGASSDMEIVFVPTDAACGQANGSVSTSVTGGTAPYTYNWSNGASTGSLNGVTAGNYGLTITDANGCTVSDFANVGNIDGPTITVDNVTDINCNGGSTGSIDITVTATTSVTYNWSNGSTAEDQTGLTAGTYAVTVADANGCSSVATFTIDQATEIVVNAGYIGVSCNGAEDGAIDVTVVGGVGPYTYAWSNGENTQDLSGLEGGVYTVTVTDANGCSASTFVNINEPDALELSASVVDVLCNGGADGSIDLTVTGGTAPYTYVWSNGGASEDLNGLTAGLYVVYVTDANGCTESLVVTVGTANTIVLNTAVTNATCGESNGSAAVFPSGGTAPYTYIWGNGGVGSSLSNIPAGVYDVIVIDGNGCSATENVVVESTSDIDVVVNTINAQCGGGANGEIELVVTGGTAPYTYIWSNNETTSTISGLTAGTYNATITDASGCNSVVSVDVTEESDLNYTTSVTAETCGIQGGNGSIDLTVGGGTAPYTVTWSNGTVGTSNQNLEAGTYTFTVTDANGCSVTGVENVSNDPQSGIIITATDITCANGSGSVSVTAPGGGQYTYVWSNGDNGSTINGLAAGTYTVTATNLDFCIVVLSATVNPADPIHVVADRTDVDCNSSATGEIDVTVTGGSAPYSTDWADGTTTEDRTGLVAGTYTITVTDANGCAASTSVEISEPNTLIATVASIDSVSCNGLADGAIDVDVTGGTAPYTYTWSPGNGATQDTSGLTAGTYTLTVVDANGCSATVSAVVGEPQPLSMTVTASDSVSCYGGNDGSATVLANGGTAPYTYEWSNAGTGATQSGLSAGSYWVIASDVNGCTSDTTYIDIEQPDSLAAQIGVTEVSCNGDGNGEIRIKVVTGGTAPYTYDWSVSGATGNVLTDLDGGTYNVTITDANGCELVETIVVDEPNALDLSASGSTSTTCPDSTDGTIDVIVAGGTAPFVYSWSDGNNTSDTRTGLAQGTYTVTVVDENGCSATQTFTIGTGTCNNPPNAVRDTAQTFENTPRDITVITNDSDPDGDNIFVTGVVTPPTNGTSTVNSDQTITYTPNDGFVGVDSFVYVICDDGIPSLCDTAVVIVIVLPERPNIKIPNGFSPNGDGINDFFEIPDLTLYPDNELLIFNRWGNEVYGASPYLNDWNGLNQDGEPLPDGTYYYILKVNDGQGTPPYTGYVVIHRGTMGN